MFGKSRLLVVSSILIAVGLWAFALQSSLLFGIVDYASLSHSSSSSSSASSFSHHLSSAHGENVTAASSQHHHDTSEVLSSSSSSLFPHFAANSRSADHINHLRSLARRREYTFDLCRPRRGDEEEFFHLSKSQGGRLQMPKLDFPLWYQDADHRTLRTAAAQLYSNFLAFDDAETKSSRSLTTMNATIPLYGTACIGIDCSTIFIALSKQVVPLGHVIVVVGESDAKSKTVLAFRLLQEAFAGRFTMFHRPEKLSCAESWNLITRMAFSIRLPDMIDFVMIVGADFVTHGKKNAAATGRHPLSLFAAHVRAAPHLVVHRFYHFSSFAFTKKGFLELGYFDEVLFPAYAEDVELHLRSVSLGMGELGRFDSLGLFSHLRSTSLKDPLIAARKRHSSRDVYIYRKWGVKMSEHQDFGLARPFKYPFNIPQILHNASWNVDQRQRECIHEMAALSRSFSNEELRAEPSAAAAPAHLSVLVKNGVRTRLCYFNASAALRPLLRLPANQRDSFEFSAKLTSMEHEF